MPLVLTRKLGQSLIIDGEAEVRLISARQPDASIALVIDGPGRGWRKVRAQLRERVAINPEVELEAVEVGRGEARLSVHAPRHVSVWRRELQDARTTGACPPPARQIAVY